MEIIPAILTKSYEDLKNKISLVKGFVPLVQIDICDGKFVKSQTWPFFAKVTQDTPFLGNNNLDKYFLAILDEREGMPFWEEVDFELDLMVADAIENFDIYSKLSPKRMIFHIEAFADANTLVEFLEGIDPYMKDIIEFGVAISPNTDIAILDKFIPFISFVQFMGIENIGLQGEEFSEKVFLNIKNFKNKYPDFIVSVDGGVNLHIASELKKLGVDRIVSGSAIYSSDDIIGKIEEFRNI
jgi:ribulose-phosphate 3-epimerase